MAPHHADVLGGDYLVANGNLLFALGDPVYDPLFTPFYADPLRHALCASLFESSGWQRTYATVISRPDPEQPERVGRSIRFGLAEFATIAGAESAFTGYVDLLRFANVEVRSAALDAAVVAQLALFRSSEEPSDDVTPMLVFRIDRVLAVVRFDGDVGDSFSAADVATTGRLFHRRIESVLASDEPTLGRGALRLQDAAGVPTTTEWYLRRDGRSVTFVIDPGGERQRQAYGKATDVYAVGQTFGADATAPAFQTFLFQFADEAAAHDWFRLWQNHLVSVDLRRATEVEIAEIAGADEFAIYRVAMPSAGDPPWFQVVARSGSYGVSVRLSGASATQVVALTRDQLTCLAETRPCRPVPLPPLESAPPATPVASPVAAAVA